MSFDRLKKFWKKFLENFEYFIYVINRMLMIK